MNKIFIFLLAAMFFRTTPAVATPPSITDVDAAELQALRLADAIFLKNSISPECYSMSMQRHASQYTFLYFDKKIDPRDLGKYLRSRFPGCAPFIIDISKDGTILNQNYFQQK